MHVRIRQPVLRNWQNQPKPKWTACRQTKTAHLLTRGGSRCMYAQRVSLESWSRTQKGKAGSVSSVHRIATSLPCVHCAQTPQSHATRWAGASNPSCCSAPARDPFRLFTPLPQGFGGDDTVKPRRRGARSTEHGVGRSWARRGGRTNQLLPATA